MIPVSTFSFGEECPGVLVLKVVRKGPLKLLSLFLSEENIWTARILVTIKYIRVIAEELIRF